MALPSRYCAATAGKSAAWSLLVASWMNAVLQDCANACSRSLTWPSPSALSNTSPSTVAVFGQLAADEGVSPLPISAVEVSTLNVEPGGKPPSTAWSYPPALTLATASRSPVLASTATSAALFFSPESAASAAFCTVGSMVVLTGVPPCPARVASVATLAPLAVTTSAVAAGVPASCFSAEASSPVWPTTLSSS